MASGHPACLMYLYTRLLFLGPLCKAPLCPFGVPLGTQHPLCLFELRPQCKRGRERTTFVLQSLKLLDLALLLATFALIHLQTLLPTHVSTQAGNGSRFRNAAVILHSTWTLRLK